MSVIVLKLNSNALVQCYDLGLIVYSFVMEFLKNFPFGLWL